MNAALFTGLTGLRANQAYIDVVGNNLANSNTVGFKGVRASFADVFNQTLRGASGPTGTLGGTNPEQLGLGVDVASLDQNFSQGTLINTGRTFDLALQGQGFFTVRRGTDILYSRAGSFGFDGGDNLIDTRTGAIVQSAGGADINIPRDLSSPAKATTAITFAGNLPAEGAAPLAEVLESAHPFENWQEAAASATPPANPLVLGATTSIQILVGGSASPVTASFAAGSYTPAQIASGIQAALQAAGASATATESGGVVTIQTTARGSDASLNLSDGTAGGAAALGFTPGLHLGTSASATGTTMLNDLSTTHVDYVPGDRIRISGTLSNGTAVSSVFTVTATTDLQDLVGAIQSTLNNEVTATLVNGKIRLTANAAGASNTTVSLTDEPGNTGHSEFGSNAFGVTVTGQDATPVNSFINVFDARGVVHNLSVTFTEQANGTWTMVASVPPDEGTVSNGTVSGITFNNDGTLQTPSSATIDVQFAGQTGTQTLTLNFQSGQNGPSLVQQAGEASAAAVSQDGRAAGILNSLSVVADGTIQGNFSNGQTTNLAVIGITLFRNPEGLERAGSTLFRATANSGDAVSGQPGQGAAGTVVSGALEGSNVDIAEEFVRLIEAQRSFQASARVISTSNEVLQDLVNLR